MLCHPKVESRELTGEPARLYNLRAVKPLNWVLQNPNFYVFFTALVLELAKGFEPPTR